MLTVVNELNLFKHMFCFENKSFQISIDFVFPSNSFKVEKILKGS